MSEVEPGEVKLSVVVPAYNAAGTIIAQLSALLQQHWPEGWEIIVADNGSNDDTVEIVTAFCDRDPRVCLVDASQRRGPSHARNVGAAHARGEYIVFCDADDVVAPGWLMALGTALRRSPAVAGPLELAELNAPWLHRVYGSKVATEPQCFANTFPFGASANLGVRSTVFAELGGFDPSIAVGEDIEFCLRLWSDGHLLAFAPEAIVHYRLRPTLTALWRQSVQYGAATPLIARLLAERGHPTTRLGGLRHWLWSARNFPLLGTEQGRARMLVVLGGAVGRVMGSVRHRTLYI